MALSEYVAFKSTIKQLLTELAGEHTELVDLDLRDGTALNDLLIEPAALLFKNFYERLSDLEEIWSLRDYLNLSEEVMDALASNFLISRLAGERSKGRVRILVSEVQKLFIPEGTVFVSETGLKFATIQDHSFTREEIILNQIGRDYFVEVTVEAESPGEEYRLDADQITGLLSDIGIDYTRVTNPDPFWGGSGVEESNEDIYDRIQKSITTRNWVANNGISLLVDEYFGHPIDKMIIGQGDSLMMRDRVYDVQAYPLDIYPYGPLVIKDFKGKIRTETFYCPHVAYYCISTLQCEEWDTFIDEFSQEEYNQIYYDDGMDFVLKDDYILYQDFGITPDLEDWVLGNDMLKWDTMLFDNQISVVGEFLVLGAKEEEVDPEIPKKWKPSNVKEILPEIIDKLKNAISPEEVERGQRIQGDYSEGAGGV